MRRPASPGRRPGFSGLPVSAGTAAGILRIVADSVVGDAIVAATPEEVAAAFAAVAAERSALAERLRKAGRTSEAEIIAIGALIAGDPALSSPAVAAVQGGADAVTAVREAAERQAAMMEQLDNPALAARAGDIRQVGVAVIARLRTGGGATAGATDAAGAGPAPVIGLTRTRGLTRGLTRTRGARLDSETVRSVTSSWCGMRSRRRI